MARKSKQPGGHNPLTAHEVKRLKSSGYGTQTARLSSTASHLPFGQCCLSLSRIPDGCAVATPSGHVYSREAIVQYLLTKTCELRRLRAEYDRLRLVVENRRAVYEENQRTVEHATFITKDQGARTNNGGSTTTALFLREDPQTNVALSSRGSSSSSSSSAFGKQQHSTALAVASESTTFATTAVTYTPKSSKQVENSLSHVSYWLASSQPNRRTNMKKGGGDDVNDITEFDYLREIEALPSLPAPNYRPSSPMSGEPLRLKQLMPLHLMYEGDCSNSNEDDEKASSSSSSSVVSITTNNTDTHHSTKKRGGGMMGGRVICSVSHKVITTQPIIALHGHVMLRDMYTQYALPTLICPITGRKVNVKRDVIELVPGRSGYAASGSVVAKKYNPTLT